MAEKLYYSMGEVAEMFDVNPSLIRHWGIAVQRAPSQAEQERQPPLYAAGCRESETHLPSGQEVRHDPRRGETGPAQSTVGRCRGREAELIERLQRIRALLLEVREDLRDVPGEVVGPDSAVDAASEAHTQGIPERAGRGVVARNDAAAGSRTLPPMLLRPTPSPAADACRRLRNTARRRPHAVRAVKGGDRAQGALFAFYEQSLF